MKLRKKTIKKIIQENDYSQPGLTCQTYNPVHEIRITQ
jgi:hypothetical protein